MRRTCPLLAVILIHVAVVPCGAQSAAPPTISPPSFTLQGKDARQRLVVTATVNGQAVDASRDAQFRSATPNVAQVSADGIVTPVGDGTGTVTAMVNGQT